MQIVDSPRNGNTVWVAVSALVAAGLLSLACAAPAHAAPSVPPISAHGPYRVGCSNVEQDLSRVPAGETAAFYWRGVSAGGVERYVTQLLVDRDDALIATFTAPNDPPLYSRWSGRTLTYALLVCYPTTGDNPYPNYTVTRDIVVPHMQRGAEPPILPSTPARLPVLLFSHGYGGSPLNGSYLDAIVAFASWGYVTVAPFHGDFRYSVFGPDNGGDAGLYVPIWDEFVAMQATRPLSLSAALDAVASHPQWRDRVDAAHVGAFGISQGGETLMLAGGASLTYGLGSLDAKRVTRDSRIRAAVGYVPYFGIESIPAFGAGQQGVADVAMPFLALSGTDDPIAPIGVTRAALDRMPGVRGQIALAGQGHNLAPSSADDIYTWTLAFLDAWLFDDAGARAKLQEAQSVQGGLDDSKVLYSTGVPNYQGLWWNAAESGWGLNLAHQGDSLYATWYTYDAAGKPTWLAMLAQRTGGETFAGDLLEVHGSPYDVPPYDPSKKTVTTVGHATLAFASRDAGTFSYTAKNVTRSVAITRLSLGGAKPACTYTSDPDLAAATNLQDLWWGGPSQDGWGVNVAHEGAQMYATWYTFDSDGSPLWLAALATRSSSDRYAGTLMRVMGPPFGPTFDPSQVVVSPFGSAEIVVDDGNTLAWRYTTPAASADEPLARLLFFAPAGTECR